MSEQPVVWIVDDDQSIRWVLDKALSKSNMNTRCFTDAESALDQLNSEVPDVLITDVRMPGMDGLTLLQEAHRVEPQLPVIVITAHSDLDSAVNSYQSGAFEYLPKPFDINEAVALANRAIEARREQQAEVQQTIAPSQRILGESVAMQEVFRIIGRLSQSNINVLINGESGTGKELVAHALHEHSPRAGKEFIALNTAAIPRDLLESELFGHEKGAFTGAHTTRKGRFEQADGGTLFLDEIGDMPADLQTRLLRVLSDGLVYRVGSHNPIHVDVRIIAATHQDLETRVREGLFREDLFHRLNVIRIRIPALRERPEDIPLLCHSFLSRAAKELAVEPKSVSPEAMSILVKSPWSGNVRQLENASRWLTIMAAGREIQVGDLPPEISMKPAESSSTYEADWQKVLQNWIHRKLSEGETSILKTVIPDMEEIMIRGALAHSGGHRQEAARLLGWGRNTLTRKIKELELDDL